MAALDVLAMQPDSKHAKRNEAIKVVQQALGDAELATLSLEHIENPPEQSKAPPTPTGPSYTCVTELPNPSSVAKILVGLFDHTPRWKLNSVINFATFARGYPTPADAVYAAKLMEAAEEWNSYKICVTFKWVPKLDDAAFVLAYGGTESKVLASAFFPNDKPLNTMYVYSYGFDKKDQAGYTNFGIMKNVFLHELGHVLGLRHEFAIEKEGGAVPFGSRDPHSIMSYTFPPKIQPSDIEGTKAFLTLPPVIDFVPDN